MIDEGYIKFRLEWEKTPALPEAELAEIIRSRQKCFEAGFIGVYPDSGIGFGNLSMRRGSGNDFIISGTQTGHLPRAGAEHFTRVTSVDFQNNTVWCSGPVKASAESLTHAVFYELDKRISAVVHIHSLQMWERLKFRIPTTSEDIPYGTLEMVQAIRSLYLSGSLPEKKIMVMAGHDEGIVSFGAGLDEAFSVLLRAV